MAKVGFKDNKHKWQIGKSKVFMKEDCRQVLERELGHALIEHTIIIQRCIKKSLFRKRLKRILSCRAISRSFRSISIANKFKVMYATKFLASKQIIVKAVRQYIKNKKLASFRKMEKENKEKYDYEKKCKEIEEERKRLEVMREHQKDELTRLDSNISTSFTKDMDFDSSSMGYMGDEGIYADYVTPGGPDDNEEYKYNEDAFNEELDALSDEIDHEEINALTTKIEELENQINNLEDERDAYKHKFMKEQSD